MIFNSDHGYFNCSLRSSKMFNDGFIANVVVNLSVKEFCKSVSILAKVRAIKV